MRGDSNANLGCWSVPLLDTIRSAILEHARRKSGGTSELRDIAVRLGRVVRALASGLSGSAGITRVVIVKYDAKAAIDALDALSGSNNRLGPKSLYVAIFEELRSTLADLAKAGVSRIVIFVDDLDRCLPASALDVLESMKLFFDLPGFVFVVGMDESVIDRAITAKNDTMTDPAGGRPGREYAKKIFQIPYTLPMMLPQQLDDLLLTMYREAGIDGDQLADLDKRVRPYLDVIAVQRRVNPREVKRFINSYTLQILIRHDLDAEAILALQTLAFRQDWLCLYEALSIHPNSFAHALREYRDGAEDQLRALLPELPEFPDELSRFLRSGLIKPLADQPDLDPYVSSLGTAIVPYEPSRSQAPAPEDIGAPPPSSARQENHRAAGSVMPPQPLTTFSLPRGSSRFSVSAAPPRGRG
jgi:hypothetical protein